LRRVVLTSLGSIDEEVGDTIVPAVTVELLLASGGALESSSLTGAIDGGAFESEGEFGIGSVRGAGRWETLLRVGVRRVEECFDFLVRVGEGESRSIREEGVLDGSWSVWQVDDDRIGLVRRRRHVAHSG